MEWGNIPLNHSSFSHCQKAPRLQPFVLNLPVFPSVDFFNDKAILALPLRTFLREASTVFIRYDKMGVVKQLAKGRSESPRDREGSGAVYWCFWFLFLPACSGWAPDPGAGTPAGQAAGSQAGVPWAGTQSHAARLTDGGSIFFPGWFVPMVNHPHTNTGLFFLMTHQ